MEDKKTLNKSEKQVKNAWGFISYADDGKELSSDEILLQMIERSIKYDALESKRLTLNKIEAMFGSGKYKPASKEVSEAIARLRESIESHVAGTTKPRKTKRIKEFTEFIKDSEHTNKILRVIHKAVGNKKDKDALRVIRDAYWAELIEIPTFTSIKNEFDGVQCSQTVFSNLINEDKPTRESMLDEIKKQFKE